jgi:membrane protease YdiL (CAAX protease family)
MDSPTPQPLFTRIFISPGEFRLRAGWRLVVHFILLLTCLVVMALVAIPIFLIAGGRAEGIKITNQLIALGSITLSVFLARRYVDRRSFRSLGLALNAQTWRDLLFGIGLGGVIMSGVFTISLMAGWLSIEGLAWDTLPLVRVIGSLLFELAIFIAVGWGEELVSRGYWLQNLEEGLNLDWAMFISTAVFALFHAANPGFSWVALIGLLIAGYLMALAYVWSRRLWLPIGIHIGWNFFQGPIFGFKVSGTDSFHLIMHSTKGPTLWTGGAFGPEAGLVLLPAVMLGAVLLWWYTRNRETIEGVPEE